MKYCFIYSNPDAGYEYLYIHSMPAWGYTAWDMWQNLLVMVVGTSGLFFFSFLRMRKLGRKT